MSDPILNFAKGTVSQGYDEFETLIEVISGDGSKFPNPSSDGEYNLVWWNSTDYGDPADDPLREIVRVISRHDDELVISRAQEGTTANAHSLPNRIYKVILALTKIKMDDVVYLNDVQTVTNKTLVTPEIPVVGSVPEAPAVGKAKIYLTATGVTPNKITEMKIKMEDGSEQILGSVVS